jgi:hypothetical protein
MEGEILYQIIPGLSVMEEGYITTFVTGSTQRDAIRNFWGTLLFGLRMSSVQDASGIFQGENITASVQQNYNQTHSFYTNVYTNAYYNVPTADENQVRTLSERFWCRVA